MGLSILKKDFESKGRLRIEWVFNSIIARHVKYIFNRNEVNVGYNLYVSFEKFQTIYSFLLVSDAQKFQKGNANHMAETVILL